MMTNGINKILVALPGGMKKRLKVVAAMNDRSLKDQVIDYLEIGLSKSEKNNSLNAEKLTKSG